MLVCFNQIEIRSLCYCIISTESRFPLLRMTLIDRD